MKLITTVALWKYISDGNCDHFMFILSENPLTTFLVA